MIYSYKNTFNCSVEKAFALFMDMDRRPEFIDIMSESGWVNKTSNIIDSVFREKMVFIGFPLHLDSDIIAYEENKHYTSKCKMAPFYPTITLKVWPEGKKCGSSLDIEIQLGPLEYLPKFIIKNQVDSIVDKMVKKYGKALNE